MTQLLLAAVACALAAPPTPSPAPAPSQLTLGARAGLSFPLGDAQGGTTLKKGIERGYPLELWAGWRVTPDFEAGLQGGYVPASVGSDRLDECSDQGVTCSAYLWRLAARGEYSLRVPGWVSVPWGAATLGWEWAVDRWELDSANWEKRSASGWLLGFEAGIDRPLSKIFEVGIYAGVSFGQYRALSVSGETVGYGYSDSGAMPDPAVHGWLSVGLRGAFRL
jgi:hypothetical protein